MGDELDGQSTIELRPSIKIPALKLGAAVFLAILSILIVIVTSREGRNPIEVGLLLVFILSLVASLNQLVTILLLRRTTYTVTDGIVKKRFHLPYMMSERELPVHQIRGIELNRGVLGTVFGFGTLVFLTAGPNQSLGFLKFKLIPDPGRHREHIRDSILDI